MREIFNAHDLVIVELKLLQLDTCIQALNTLDEIVT